MQEILSQLGDLLAVSPSCGAEQRLLTAEDQMFLFEATGMLIVVGSFSAQVNNPFYPILARVLIFFFYFEGKEIIHGAASRKFGLQILTRIGSNWKKFGS